MYRQHCQEVFNNKCVNVSLIGKFIMFVNRTLVPLSHYAIKDRIVDVDLCVRIVAFALTSSGRLSCQRTD